MDNESDRLRVAVVGAGERRLSEIALMMEELRRRPDTQHVLVVDSLRPPDAPPELPPEALAILDDFNADLARKRFTEKLKLAMAEARAGDAQQRRNKRKSRSRKRRGK